MHVFTNWCYIIIEMLLPISTNLATVSILSRYTILEQGSVIGIVSIMTSQSILVQKWWPLVMTLVSLINTTLDAHSLKFRIGENVIN